MNSDEAQFETDLAADRASGEPALVVDVEGFEGPLDLLLALARQQKVDLAKISILALAAQYLTFIEAARKIRLELAADYRGQREQPVAFVREVVQTATDHLSHALRDRKRRRSGSPISNAVSIAGSASWVRG